MNARRATPESANAADTAADYAHHFSDFGGRIWLNASHQGPLPNVAVEAARRAIELKQFPFNVSTTEPFNEAPERLRAALARLIGADENDVILGNSASHGLHVLALGIDFRQNDEVLLVEGDFPSTTFPFLLLRDRGVRVRFIQPRGRSLDPAELRASLTPRTRAFCTTWVHSFSGHALDLDALGEICARNGTRFLVNGSQAVGARPIDVSAAPIDALVGVGFKWLCGPYGTGYCWIAPDLLAQMKPTQLYWLAHLTADDLKRDAPLEPKNDVGARGYDIFGTANFNNFMPWTASIELFNSIGVSTIERHVQMLISRMLEHLDSGLYELRSPREGPSRSSIVVLSHRDRSRNEAIFERMREAGIDHSLRKGNLRFAPHFYNTTAQIDAAADALNRFGR